MSAPDRDAQKIRWRSRAQNATDSQSLDNNLPRISQRKHCLIGQYRRVRWTPEQNYHPWGGRMKPGLQSRCTPTRMQRNAACAWEARAREHCGHVLHDKISNSWAAKLFLMCAAFLDKLKCNTSPGQDTHASNAMNVSVAGRPAADTLAGLRARSLNSP